MSFALSTQHQGECLHDSSATLDDIRAAPKAVKRARPQATRIWASAFTYQVIADGRQLAEAGAVVTYSVDWPDMFRRSTTYFDKILQGPSPLTCRSSSQQSSTSW